MRERDADPERHEEDGEHRAKGPCLGPAREPQERPGQRGHGTCEYAGLVVRDGEEERERPCAEGSSQRERLEGPRELVGGTRDDDEQDGEHGPLAEGYAGKRDRREHQGGRCPPPEHGSPRRRPGAWTVTRKTPGRAGTPQGRNRARACPSRRTRRRLSARAKSSIRAAPRWSGSPDRPRVRRGVEVSGEGHLVDVFRRETVCHYPS